MKNDKILFFEYSASYFDVYLRKQCGRSEFTIKSYRDALTVFRRFINNEKHISIMKFCVMDCTKELALEFIEYMRKENSKATTINHHISVLKGYLFYVADIDITYQSIAISVSHIPKIKVPKRKKGILNDEMLKEMFKATKNNKTGIRNRTIMILLYETAVRVGELIQLKKENLFISDDESYIFVQGKGDKERIVGLSSKTIKHLNFYLSIYHKEDISDYIFYTVIKGSANCISVSTVETFIQRYADEVRILIPDIPKHVYPHMFRRSRATHLYRDNVPLELISRVLGHSSTDTTKDYYTTPSLEQMRKVVENKSDIDVEPEWENEDRIAKLFGIR